MYSIFYVKSHLLFRISLLYIKNERLIRRSFSGGEGDSVTNNFLPQNFLDPVTPAFDITPTFEFPSPPLKKITAKRGIFNERAMLYDVRTSFMNERAWVKFPNYSNI